jgi:hypothetical protein
MSRMSTCRLVVEPEPVDADDDVLAPVDPCLPAGGGFLDPHLRQSLLDRLGHAAQRLHFGDQFPGLLGKVSGQLLDIIGAAERIDDIGDAGLVRQDQLRVPRDTGREFRRQRDRLVERIGVQRLGAAEHCRHCLERGADHVVVRVLLGQRHARCLAVSPKHLRAFGLGAEIGHDLRPHGPCGAQFRRFHEHVHADAEEERQPPGKGVDIEPLGLCGTDIFHAVGERVGEFLRQRRAGFLHVIAGNRDRVELRHFGRGELDDVGNDPHRRLGRIDIGVADHEFLEDVVLHRAGELGPLDALFLAGDDEHRQHRDDGAVHGHRHAHLAQRNPVEQDLHVLD